MTNQLPLTSEIKSSRLGYLACGIESSCLSTQRSNGKVNKLYLAAGALSLVLATFGFMALALNSFVSPGDSAIGPDIESSINLASSSKNPSPAAVPTSLLATPQTGSGATFSQAQQTRLLNQLQGLNNQFFPSNYQRYESHIFSDKLVYIEGEYFFLSVILVDPFTKIPVQNVNAPDIPIYIDVVDYNGNTVNHREVYYYGNSAMYVSYFYLNGGYTGTYTIRVYGDNIISSYRQIKILTEYDFSNDFPVIATPTKQWYSAGDVVTLNITLPVGFSYQGETIFVEANVLFADIATASSNYVNFTAAANSDTHKQIQFTIPKTTNQKESIVNVSLWYETNPVTQYYSTVLVPLYVRPGTIQIFQWTESLAPITDAAYQKFYVYGYYGTSVDFLSGYKDAFVFPIDMSNVVIKLNTTVKGKAKTNTVIKYSGGTTDHTGFYTFTVLSVAGDVYSVSLANPNVSTSYQGFTFTYKDILPAYAAASSTPEIYFGLQSKVIASNGQATLNVYTNNKLDSTQIYLLVVKYKEKYVYSNFYNFTYVSTRKLPVNVTTINIPNSNLQYAGAYQVILYHVTAQFTSFSSGYAAAVTPPQQSSTAIQTWLEMRGTTTFYKKPPTAALSFQVVPDNPKGYYPADYVNLKIVTLNAATGKPTGADSYLTYAVVDEQAFNGQQVKTPSGPSLSYKLFVENEFPFATYPLSNYYSFLDPSFNASSQFGEALIATQVLRNVFSDFIGLGLITSYATATTGSLGSTPEKLQIVQRYFGSPFRNLVNQGTLKPLWSQFTSAAFKSYQYVADNKFLAATARQQFWDAYDLEYINQQNSDTYYKNLTVSHDWPDYQGNPFSMAIDFTATVSFGSTVYAKGGVYSAKMVLNDNNTQYWTYVEGMTSTGSVGSGWAPQAIVASNVNRGPPVVIGYPQPNNYVVDGDSLVVYFQLTNHLNFDLSCTAHGLSTSPVSSPNLLFSALPTQLCAANQVSYVGVKMNANTAGTQVDWVAVVEFYRSRFSDPNDYPIEYSTYSTYGIEVISDYTDVINYASGLIGQNIPVVGTIWSSKKVALTIPSGDQYDTLYSFFGGIIDDIHLMYLFIGNYLNTGGVTTDQYTFDDMASLTYVMDNVYNTMTATNDEIGIAPYAQQQFCQLYSQGMSLFWDESAGGYSNIPGGPPSDILNAQAYLYLGASTQTCINQTQVLMIQRFILRGRDSHGVYHPQTPITAPQDPLLTQAYIVYVLTSVPGFRYIALEQYGGLQLDLDYLFQAAWNQTTYSMTTQDPFMLSLALLAMSNAKRAANVTYLGCYLVKFQNSSGHFYRNDSWIAVQSPFLSSKLQRAVELQALGYFALKAAGYLQNATLAFQALWDYGREGDFGGNQANILGMQVLSDQYLQGYVAIPSNYSTNFNVYVNDYFGGKYEFGGNGEFQGENEVIYYTLGSTDLVDGYGNAYFSDGTQLQHQIQIRDYVATDQEDYYFYLTLGVSAYQGTMPSSSSSPIYLTVSQSLGAGNLGLSLNLNKRVTFTIGLRNRDPFNYANVRVNFRIPSCAAFDPTITQLFPGATIIANYDPFLGVLTLILNYLPASVLTNINLILVQSFSGKCLPRQISALVNDDDSTLVIARYT